MSKYLTNSQLCERFNVDRSTSWRWRKSGFLPAPDLILKGRPRWLVETIEDWETRHDARALNTR